MEYYNKKNLNYLKENKSDLNDAIVITNNNFVDYLLYELNHNFIIRKFPFMIITQVIHLNISNQYFIFENLNNLLFIHFDDYKNNINIKSIDKSKIGKNEQSTF